MIRETHGIADAIRVDTSLAEGKNLQGVMVEDGMDGLVLLGKTSASHAGLTPAQARLLAKMLNASAARIDKVTSEGKR